MVKNTFLFCWCRRIYLEISDIKASLSVRAISNQNISATKINFENSKNHATFNLRNNVFIRCIFYDFSVESSVGDEKTNGAKFGCPSDLWESRGFHAKIRGNFLTVQHEAEEKFKNQQDEKLSVFTIPEFPPKKTILIRK